MDHKSGLGEDGGSEEEEALGQMCADGVGEKDQSAVGWRRSPVVLEVSRARGLLLSSPEESGRFVVYVIDPPYLVLDLPFNGPGYIRALRGGDGVGDRTDSHVFGTGRHRHPFDYRAGTRNPGAYDILTDSVARVGCSPDGITAPFRYNDRWSRRCLRMSRRRGMLSQTECDT